MCQIVSFLIFISSLYAQKIGYNEICNNTEECSDHRYECREDSANSFRCLCDRFHAWNETTGCIQLYNATEIMNMTITVTDQIRSLDDQVKFIMQAQIAAGVFVFIMVIVAAVTVTTFCIYVHITDHKMLKQLKKEQKLKKFGQATSKV